MSDRLAPVLSLRLHYPSCLGYPCFFLFKTFPTPTSRSDINSTPIKTRLVMTPFKELFTECVYHPSCLCCPPESWKQYVSQENISASGWWMLPRSLLNSTMEALRTYSCVRAKLFQSYLTLCDPMDCSLPSCSVHGIFPARILEWISRPSWGIFPT